MTRFNILPVCEWGFRCHEAGARAVSVSRADVVREYRTFCRYHARMARNTYGAEYTLEVVS